MYCPNCNAETDTTVRVVQETYPVKGENITINATVRFCNICGCDIWDEELDSKNLLLAYEEYRRKHNLMAPEDIKEIRTKYNLSQTAFARILGMGDKTITRYENGSIADAAQNNLLCLVQQPHNFAELLEQNKDKISQADYEKAQYALEQLRCRTVSTHTAARCTYDTTPKYNYNMQQYWGDRRHA